MGSNRIEHVLADLGAMHAGTTAMSIYNTLSPSQVAYVAAHSEPAVVVLESADHVARWSPALASGSTTQVVLIDPDQAHPPAPSPGISCSSAAAPPVSSNRPRSTSAGGDRPPAAGHDPLHLGHHRQPRGRGDHPPQRALRGREQHPLVLRLT
ncbi:MAG: AMP-binding protein [Marmoricola sp.]